MKPKNNESTVAGLVSAPQKDFLAEKCLTFGENMRNARKDRGFTSEALGRFLGISTAYVGLIERGERCPSLETFLKICDFFGESYDDMFTQRGGLFVREKKTPTSEKDPVVRKQRMIAGMLNNFGTEELDHIIGVIKSFKNFSHKNRTSGHQDTEFAGEFSFSSNEVAGLE